MLIGAKDDTFWLSFQTSLLGHQITLTIEGQICRSFYIGCSLYVLLHYSKTFAIALKLKFYKLFLSLGHIVQPSSAEIRLVHIPVWPVFFYPVENIIFSL